MGGLGPLTPPLSTPVKQRRAVSYTRVRFCRRCCWSAWVSRRTATGRPADGRTAVSLGVGRVGARRAAGPLYRRPPTTTGGMRSGSACRRPEQCREGSSTRRSCRFQIHWNSRAASETSACTATQRHSWCRYHSHIAFIVAIIIV